MGLAIIEAIMNAEERFGIRIEDAEAEQLRTAGDLCALVLEKLKPKPAPPAGGPCPSSVAFYRVRRALMETAGIPRRSIRPDSRFEAILPWWKRGGVWAGLQASLGVPLPALRPHPVANTVCLLLAAPFGLIALVSALAAVSGFPSLLAAGIPCAVLVLLAQRVAGAWAPQLPASCSTVHAVVERLVSFGLVLDDSDGTRARVCSGVCEVLSSAFGQQGDAGSITPETTLEELGLD